MSKHSGFTISRHARRRMSQRGITAEQVRRAMEHPTGLEPDPDDSSLTHALKRFHRQGGSTVLRVVYNHVAQPPLVVTAFFDRRLKGMR